MLFLSACTSAGLWLANAGGGGDAILTSNVFYGVAGQALDIYAPKSAANAPVIMFFYGGRWTTGKKEQYAFIGQDFARAGYVTVIVDHRKYPTVRFPSFIEDGARAVAWVEQHIGLYGGKPDQIYLMGHSSGAHIASLIVADERYLKQAGGSMALIKGFVGLAGPYDFTPEEADVKDIFGPPSHYPAMQATTFIDGHEPPMLLLHGARDETVKQYNLERLVAAINAKGGRVQTKIYPDLNHVGIIASLTWLKDKNKVVEKDILAFLAQNR